MDYQYEFIYNCKLYAYRNEHGTIDDALKSGACHEVFDSQFYSEFHDKLDIVLKTENIIHDNRLEYYIVTSNGSYIKLEDVYKIENLLKERANVKQGRD